MARPEAFSELTNVSPKTAVTFDQSNFPTTSTFYNALGNFLASCEKLNLVVTKNYNSVNVTVPFTSAEMRDMLTEAQERWDRNYKDATSETPPESSYRRDSLIRFAETEQLPVPSWA